MSKVTVAGFLVADTLAQGDDASMLLAEHIRLSRAEPGCERFEIVRSQADPVRFALFEVFRDDEAYQAHQERARASAWWAKTRHLRREFTVSRDTDV
jgi:quinol monooxygenase YgiN